jgi:hypothetical protein
MASATRLPLKSILFTTSIVLGVGASRVGLREILLKTVTGPGKYKRIAVILLLFANIKNVPFFWHVSKLFCLAVVQCINNFRAVPSMGSDPSTLPLQ